MRSPAVVDSYPLSPLQQGMLFHAVSAPSSGVDIEQIVCTLRQPVDAAALESAWRKVADRHAILRSAFRWDDEPVQEVFAETELSWLEEDLRMLPASHREQHFVTFLADDRSRGFAMNEAPLFRLTWFHFAEHEARLVWTFHHALLDGRSFLIVLREVFAFYFAEVSGTALDLPQPRPFRDHIDFLQSHQGGGSEGYWREMLRGFTAPTPLVVDGLPGCAKTPGQADYERRLSRSATDALRAFAATNALTLNTVVQGAWALLLSRYSGEKDIVFGATRACRRSSVESATEMVGLFINTLPVRTQPRDDLRLVPWLQ